MNKKLNKYKKELQDEILENNNKAYQYEMAMKSHQVKSKEASEILELLERKEG